MVESSMTNRSLNTVYSKPTMRRRYEVWFVRLMLADGGGAWWFRYLLINLGRPGGGGCPGNPHGWPVQVWAIWFPKNDKPQSFIRGFPRDNLSLSQPGAAPFHFQIQDNRIGEDACAGRVEAGGHAVTWDLNYRSTFGVTVSNVGWIGFARTPHANAVFDGGISLDGRTFQGKPLGYGVQGHNCGFRHRHSWNWAHAIFLNRESNQISSFEALEYEMPFGLRFKKALLWHGGTLYVFRKMKEIVRHRENLQWMFHCSNPNDGSRLIADIDGRGHSLHRLPYLKTDCSSTFKVANNSLARCSLYLFRRGNRTEQMSTDGGAAIEMVGE